MWRWLGERLGLTDKAWKVSNARGEYATVSARTRAEAIAQVRSMFLPADRDHLKACRITGTMNPDSEIGQ